MSKKLLVIIVSLVVVLGGLGGAYVWLNKGEAKEPTNVTKPKDETPKVDTKAEEAKQKEALKKQAQILITKMNQVHLVKNEQEFEKWLSEVYYEPNNFREAMKEHFRPGDFTKVKVTFSKDDVVNSPNEDGLFTYISTYTAEITGSDGKVYKVEESLTFNFAKNKENQYRIFLVQ